MRTVFSIEACVRQPKALHRPAMQKVFCHNFIYVFYLDEAVPNRLGIDDNHRPMLALVKTTGLVRANAMLQARIFNGVLECRFELFAALWKTTRTRCRLVTFVGADKDMMLKFRHGPGSLLSRLAIDMRSARLSETI